MNDEALLVKKYNAQTALPRILLSGGWGIGAAAGITSGILSGLFNSKSSNCSYELSVRNWAVNYSAFWAVGLVSIIDLFDHSKAMPLINTLVPAMLLSIAGGAIAQGQDSRYFYALRAGYAEGKLMAASTERTLKL